MREPLVGAHMSVAGGLAAMVRATAAIGGNCAQVFTTNPQQWGSREYTAQEIADFRAALAETGVWPIVAHDSYLVNPASSDPVLLARSRTAFAREIERCGLLGIPLLVMHWGSHKGYTLDEGIETLCETLSGMIPLADGHGVTICLETTAAQGQYLGGDFAHFARVFADTPGSQTLGVCFDTCHTFVAGYDQRTADTYEATWAEFDRRVGRARLRVIHVNDALKDLGSRVDRHQHLGEGAIGTEAFRLLMRDERLAHVPKIVETPQAEERHAENIRILRELAVPTPAA